MLCGCALVCTDIEGHKEYAFEGETALLVEPGNAEMMADRIRFLINDDDYRMNIAKRGHNYVLRFNWDNAVRTMEEVMKSLL
jgi:glycosyltransferase involved in cell wall biosynthesis